MNLLLLKSQELTSNTSAVIEGKRADHLRFVLKLQNGSLVSVGIANQGIYVAQAVDTSNKQVHLTLDLNTKKAPPEPLPCTLVIALPRPKMFRRIMQNVASLGVKKIHVIHCWKVEKSYWQSPLLSKNSIESCLWLGCEQAKDTVIPKMVFHHLFKPFVEDLLPQIIGKNPAYIAHPYAPEPCPLDTTTSSTLIIGPEGGFTEYEVAKLQQAGASAVSLGQRILRTETAVTALLSRVYKPL